MKRSDVTAMLSGLVEKRLRSRHMHWPAAMESDEATGR
jgi:hypothetical protein